MVKGGLEPRAIKKAICGVGGLLIVFGVMGLSESFADLSLWVWGAVLAASGVGVLAAYLTERSVWRRYSTGGARLLG